MSHMLRFSTRSLCVLVVPVILTLAILQRDFFLSIFPFGSDVSSFGASVMQTSITLTSIPGYFLQDDPKTNPVEFDYVGVFSPFPGQPI